MSWRSGQLKPVELDLLARWVVMTATSRPLAPWHGSQCRPHLKPTKSPGERRVAALMAELAHLVEQRGLAASGVVTEHAITPIVQRPIAHLVPDRQLPDRGL